MSSPLSLGELACVWVDEPAAPFQIALIGVFDAGPFRRDDGTIDVDTVRAELGRRARRVPALRRQVAWPARGRPCWTEDADPSPERQIAVAALPPGVHFLDWCAQRIMRPVGLDGPLWRAEVVDGLDGGRFGLVIVVHHVLADGLTGVALAGALLDQQRDAHPDDAPTGADRPVRQAVQDGGRPAGTTPRRAVHRLRAARDWLRDTWRRTADAAADFRTSAPVTSLSGPIGADRRLATVRQPLDDLHTAGHQLGATVNDLLLAAVTQALRELLLHRGNELPTSGLRASLPVGARVPGQPDGILLVTLPVAEPDLLRTLERIRDSTARSKSRLASGGGDVLDVLHLPLPVARMAVRWMRRIAGRRINLFITNVPGPAQPLWLAGARLLEAYPVAPLVRGLSLDVAALSYDGMLHVSVNADGAVTDLDVLTAGMQRSFAALVGAARAGARLPAAPAEDGDLRGARGVIENTRGIDREPEAVFAHLSDPRHELDWNPQLLEVEQLTEGPLGVGTRFRMRLGHGVGDSTVTYLDFDPPHRWAAMSTSRRLDVRAEGVVEPIGGGSRLVVRTLLVPRGPLRPLAPVLRRYMHRTWTRNLTAVKAELENPARGEPDARGSGVREPLRQHP
jgi:diacylglycerol O-acyltransferase